MFKLTHPLPNKYWVAISGGIDSAAVFHWLNKPSNKDRLLGAVYVNHGTEYGSGVEWLLDEYYEKKLGINVVRFKITDPIPDGESKEKFWRDQRLAFFDKVPGNDPIILAHNLDDCLEEMVMCSFVRGYEATIPYSNGRCIRPFRLWSKKDIRSYAARQSPPFPWLEDPSNMDTKYRRNFIRHNIVPQIKKLNPGVYKVVERLVRHQDEEIEHWQGEPEWLRKLNAVESDPSWAEGEERVGSEESLKRFLSGDNNES